MKQMKYLVFLIVTLFSLSFAFTTRSLNYNSARRIICKFRSAKLQAAKKSYKVTVQGTNYRFALLIFDLFDIFAKKHEGKDFVLNVREDVSILEAALDANIQLPHDCKLGVCLTCPSKLVSGQIDQSAGTLDLSVQEKVVFCSIRMI